MEILAFFPCMLQLLALLFSSLSLTPHPPPSPLQGITRKNELIVSLMDKLVSLRPQEHRATLHELATLSVEKYQQVGTERGRRVGHLYNHSIGSCVSHRTVPGKQRTH